MSATLTIAPKVRCALSPQLRRFMESLCLGLPDYVSVRVEAGKPPNRNQGICWSDQRFRKGAVLWQRFWIRALDWRNDDVWIHEFAHVLDYVGRPGVNPKGCPGHNPGWGSAYGLCFSLWEGAVVQLEARPGIVRCVFVETGEKKEYEAP